MKKRVLSRIGVFIFVVCAFFINAEDLSAYTDISIRIGQTKVIKDDYGHALVDIKGIHSKTKIKVEITNVSVYDDAGNIINDTIEVSLADDLEDTLGGNRYVRTGETLTFTEYVEGIDTMLHFSTDSFNRFSLDVTLSKVAEASLTISCHKPITMKDNGVKKVHPKVYYGGEDVSEFAHFKVKASKKNFVDIDTSDSDIEDYFELYGEEKSGKCKITVTAKYKGKTCSDSFVLTIKSTLKKNLYVRGNLYSYDTRNNVFKMSLTNRSKKQIVIYSNNAVALDDDYVAFDRKVKLTKNRKKIVIKPGKSKTIGWKVIGKLTWYKVGDFEIHFKCKYKGKVTWLSVQQSEVYVWKKGKWKKMS